MGVAAEVADRVDADTEGVQLAGIIRLKDRLKEAIEKHDAAQPILVPTPGTPAADVDTNPPATSPSVQELLAKAERVIADAVHASSGTRKAILGKLLDDHGPWALGGKNGLRWAADVKPKSKNVELLKLSKKTLMSIPCSDYDKYLQVSTQLGLATDKELEKAADKMIINMRIASTEWLICALSESDRDAEEKRSKSKAIRRKIKDVEKGWSELLYDKCRNIAEDLMTAT